MANENENPSNNRRDRQDEGNPRNVRARQEEPGTPPRQVQVGNPANPPPPPAAQRNLAEGDWRQRVGGPAAPLLPDLNDQVAVVPPPPSLGRGR